MKGMELNDGLATSNALATSNVWPMLLSHAIKVTIVFNLVTNGVGHSK